MKRRLATKPIVPSLALVALSVGMMGCPTPPPGIADRSPYRDGWVVEVDADFKHTVVVDGEKVPEIFQLAIGGRESNDNYANRGDIIVNFDGPEDRILIEMRRFTFTTNEQAAEVDFDDLALWASDGSLPNPPGFPDEANDCITGGWRNGCEVRVLFDGQSQLKRSGADLRVTLPPSYRQDITIITQDNIEEGDYLNRGNVCVSNLNASADIQLESGNAWVTFDRNVVEAPKCTDEELAACENWMVDDGMGNQVPAPWAPECNCISSGKPFGRLVVESRDDTSANITVDVPGDLWTTVKVENTGDGQESAGYHCDAAVELANFVPGETGNDFPWQAQGSVNYPGEPAINGAGYSMQLTSAACTPVAFTESPDDFVGKDKGDEQESEDRGNVTVCADCITQRCDELIP